MDLDLGVAYDGAMAVLETNVADVDGDKVVSPPALTGRLAPEQEELGIVGICL